MRQRSFALLVVCLAVAGCDGDEPVTSSTTGSTAPAGTTTTGSTSSTAATTPAMPSTPDAYATAFIAAWVAADRDAASALATPEAKAAAERSGIEIRYLGPDALGAMVQRETEYWAQVIKA